MILYNVTVNVDPEIHDEWLGWMKNVHIPDVMNTGLFVDNKIFKIQTVEDEGNTYSIQYFCKTMNDYKKYQNEHAPRLQKEHSDKYKDKFTAFRTILEQVD